MNWLDEGFDIELKSSASIVCELNIFMKSIIAFSSTAIISLVILSPAIASNQDGSQPFELTGSIQKSIKTAQFGGIFNTIKKGQDVLERQRRIEESQRRREEARRRREQAEQRRQERTELKRKRQEEYDATRKAASEQQRQESESQQPASQSQRRPSLIEQGALQPEDNAVPAARARKARSGKYYLVPQKPKDDMTALAIKYHRAIERNDFDSIDSLYCTKEKVAAGVASEAMDPQGRNKKLVALYRKWGYSKYDIDLTRMNYKTVYTDQKGEGRALVAIAGPVLMHDNGGAYVFPYQQVFRTKVQGHLRMIRENGQWKLCENTI